MLREWGNTKPSARVEDGVLLELLWAELDGRNDY